MPETKPLPKGTRIEIPVHYNLWAQGARYGTVTGYRNGHAGQSDYITVRMDNAQVKHSLKVWRMDWSYCKEVD